MLRICKIENVELPVGTPIKFEGKQVGHVIRGNEKGICECVIDDDNVSKMIRRDQCSYSMEVVYK